MGGGQGDKGKGKKGKGKFTVTKNMWQNWNLGNGAQLPLTGSQWMNWMLGTLQNPLANSFSAPVVFQLMFTLGFQPNSVTVTNGAPSTPARAPGKLTNMFAALSASAN